MSNIKDLFGDSDEDDDDFTPAERNQRQPSSAPSDDEAEAGAGASREGAEPAREPFEDDDDGFRDKPVPRQPAQLREHSDEDDEVVQESYQEAEKGPPTELQGFLLPFPAPNSLKLLHASKFLGIQPAPMTRNSLLQEGYTINQEGQAEFTGYNNQLTIRWRQRTLPSGESVPESNARFVTWSDGSKQLLLGDEVLDIADLDNASANQFLFVRHHGTTVFIQGQGRLNKKMQLRPASLHSKFHKQLLADSQKKHERMSRVKTTATVADPSRAKAEREKAEEARIRSNESLLRKQDKEMKKYPAPSRREARGSAMTPQYLETLDEGADYSDDEEDDPEATATERARAALQRRPQRDDAEEAEAERRLARAKQSEPSWARAPSSGKKRARVDDEEEDTKMQDFIVDEDEEDEDIGRKQPAKKGRRGGLVISDDEDD